MRRNDWKRVTPEDPSRTMVCCLFDQKLIAEKQYDDGKTRNGGTAQPVVPIDVGNNSELRQLFKLVNGGSVVGNSHDKICGQTSGKVNTRGDESDFAGQNYPTLENFFVFTAKFTPFRQPIQVSLLLGFFRSAGVWFKFGFLHFV